MIENVANHAFANPTNFTLVYSVTTFTSGFVKRSAIPFLEPLMESTPSVTMPVSINSSKLCV